MTSSQASNHSININEEERAVEQEGEQYVPKHESASSEKDDEQEIKLFHPEEDDYTVWKLNRTQRSNVWRTGSRESKLRLHSREGYV